MGRIIIRAEFQLGLRKAGVGRAAPSFLTAFLASRHWSSGQMLFQKIVWHGGDSKNPGAR